jgi:hypothetical protein
MVSLGDVRSGREIMNTIWLDAAVGTQLGAVLNHQITTNIDLFPLNNVRHLTRRERALESLSSGVIMCVPLLLLVSSLGFRIHLLAYASAGLELFLFIGASLTWWPPYLLGRAVPWAAMGEDWLALHERTFAKTLMVVPPYKGRPRPNLEHIILHLLMLAGALATAAYAAS